MRVELGPFVPDVDGLRVSVAVRVIVTVGEADAVEEVV